MKPIKKVIILAAILIGIISNSSLIYLAIISAIQRNYVVAVVSILCCVYSSYYIVVLCVIYRNIKQAEIHSKIAKQNNMGAFGYIARDATGHLYYHEQEPEKNLELGIWQSNGKKAPFPKRFYKGVNWEDNKSTNCLLPSAYFED